MMLPPDVSLKTTKVKKDWQSDYRRRTYSSRIKLPTDTPPQLMPPTILPAKLSRLG